MSEHMQIGVVAERIGLSLRTIRYYEEVGLVVPSARTNGGFRLYTESDVDRLRLIMRMKPLGFQLDEMREVLDLIADDSSGERDSAERQRRLAEYAMLADQRCEKLRNRLSIAEEFAATLHTRLGSD